MKSGVSGLASEISVYGLAERRSPGLAEPDSGIRSALSGHKDLPRRVSENEPRYHTDNKELTAFRHSSPP